MIFVPVQHLRSGMKVGRPVLVGDTVIPLLVENQTITPPAIQHLKHHGINGVYIQSTFCSDVTIDEFITPEFKKEMTDELKGMYRNYIKKAPLTPTMGRNMILAAEKLLKMVLSKSEHLLNVIEIKDYDSYTYSHSIYVGTLAVLIGLRLGYPENTLSELALAGMLHDVGKLNVPIEIVNKPSSLAPEELEEMRKHPEYAVQQLKTVGSVPHSVLRGIEGHHERYDGTGYPHGLEGTRIPLYSRILAVADVYDALTSSRSYRRAWLPNEALEYMMGCASTHFDHDLLVAFCKTVAAYPVGSIVELSNGEFGVVVENNSDNSLRPVVRLISPETKTNTQIDLNGNLSYMNVTVLGTISESTELPANLFKK